MEEHIVRILSIEPLTHNVNRIRVEKPEGYKFIPGQATEVGINEEGRFKDNPHPFTFTGLNSDPFLEFSIKIYSDHDGLTNRIGQLKPGDELIIHDVWGAIQYKGPGTFIAGGAGITPFLAIFKQLKKDGEIEGNQLIFSNRLEKDIILKDEIKEMLGNHFINTLTEEDLPQYDNRLVDKDYLKEKISTFDQNFYICGPDPMVAAIKKALSELGASNSVITVEM